MALTDIVGQTTSLTSNRVLKSVATLISNTALLSLFDSRLVYTEPWSTARLYRWRPIQFNHPTP